MKINTANTILYCTHWSEAVAFYRDLLKLPIYFSNEWFVEFGLTGDARLSVANEANASIKSGGGAGITLSFNVDDLDAMRATLADLAVDCSPIKGLWGSRVFYVHDPEGNRIEFWASG